MRRPGRGGATPLSALARLSGAGAGSAAARGRAAEGDDVDVQLEDELHERGALLFGRRAGDPGAKSPLVHLGLGAELADAGAGGDLAQTLVRVDERLLDDRQARRGEFGAARSHAKGSVHRGGRSRSSRARRRDVLCAPLPRCAHERHASEGLTRGPSVRASSGDMPRLLELIAVAAVVSPIACGHGAAPPAAPPPAATEDPGPRLPPEAREDGRLPLTATPRHYAVALTIDPGQAR